MLFSISPFKNDLDADESVRTWGLMCSCAEHVGRFYILKVSATLHGIRIRLLQTKKQEVN
jgi:hypothetical protein